MPRYALPLVLTLLASFAIDAGAPEGDNARPVPLAAVDGHERRTDGDVIVLHGGDRLTGTVLDEGFALRTPYGDVELPLHRCAGIASGPEARDERTIVTVNRNRLSGRLLRRSVRFRIDVSGDTIDVRHEKIERVVLRRVDHERRGLLEDPGLAWLELTNGDRLTGRLGRRVVDLVTEYATVSLRLEEVGEIALDTPGKPAATVTMRSGDVLRGRLLVPALAFALDLGPTLERIPLRLVERVHLDGLPASWFEAADVSASRGGATPVGTAARFFHAQAPGARVGFVVDKSGSMTQGDRMTLVREELARSLAALPDGAATSVLFFGGAVARPPGAKGWIRVSRAAVGRIVTWADGLEPGGPGIPLPALAETLALTPPPDVVFFLTDGPIPPDTASRLAVGRPERAAVILHVIALGSRDGQDDLARLAAGWGGAYHFVHVP